MSRLIDADKILINGIKNKTIEISYEDLPGDLEKIFTLLFKDVRKFIDDQPTVDAVPVVHGHWIERTDYVGDTYYDCSACGESWTTIEGDPWDNGMNYCPKCGAKMDDLTHSNDSNTLDALGEKVTK